jgi:peroxiredoxin
MVRDDAIGTGRQQPDTAAPPMPPLPAGLPVPVDDGAANHLRGMRMPRLTLDGTLGPLDVSALRHLVLFLFPRIGRPDEPNPPGWDEIPGARGCTQETCAYRDLSRAFAEVGYDIAGVSAQPLSALTEAAQRLHVPYPLASDPAHRLGDALRLPMFSVAGETLYRRLTLVVDDGEITKTFYPIFPPQDNAPDVLHFLQARPQPARGFGTPSDGGSNAER